MPQKVYSDIGSLIRKRRSALGLTQTELAERIGLARTTVTMMERGSQAILVHQLLDIASALRVSPSELLLPADVGETLPDETPSMVQALKLLEDLDRPVRKVTR